MPAPSHHIQPLITIVIPTYNRLKFLQEAIASVIAQTYTNWELIIVDDGSATETKETIQSLSEQRIKLLSIPHCGNIALLRNTGVAAGSGEWLAFLDSDDVWVSDRLELQLCELRQEPRCWSYGGSELMDETRQAIPFRAGNNIALSGWIIEDLLVNKVSASIGSLLIDRKLFEKIGGFNNSIKAREDFELTLRLAMEAEVLAVPNILVHIREHAERRTNAFKNGNERTASVYRHFITTCSDKKLRAIAQRRMAHELTDAAKKNIRQRKYWKATRQLTEALIKRDKIKHILSVFH